MPPPAASSTGVFLHSRHFWGKDRPARVHLPIKGADGQLEGIDLLKMQLQQKPMMRHDPAVQRLAQFSEASQSAKARRPLVVVSNVLTSRLTIPFTIWRTQATTVSLCTSRPAQ